MKKTLNFNKGFLPAAIFSCVIIALGVVGFFVRGINLGLDFRPGLIEEIRVASPVADISYSGAASVSMDLSAGQMDIIISGTGAIQGFAVSLAIGVVSSVFTALFVSRLIFDFDTDVLHAKKVSIGWGIK